MRKKTLDELIENMFNKSIGLVKPNRVFMLCEKVA